jgi:hypothetical protein
MAFTVSDNDNGAEAESSATLDHFGHTADMHNFVYKLIFFNILLVQGLASL